MYILGSIVVLLISTQLFLTFYFSNYIKEEIQKEIATLSGSQYKFDVKKLRINLIPLSVKFTAVTIQPDFLKASSALTYHATFDEINLKNLSATDFLFNRNLVAFDLKVINPSITIYRNPLITVKDTIEKNSAPKINPKIANKLILKKFILTNVKINLYSSFTDTIPTLSSSKNKIVFDALGHVRIEAARKLSMIDDNEFSLLYVTEFPQFEYDEEEKRYAAMHHPFTSPMDEDMHLLESDPKNVRAKAYDMVLNGVELGGGSLRIYNSEIQQKMFKVLGFTSEEAWEKFGFLLEAFKYGTPPHGGIAFGLDRLIMLMAKQDSIREVIAFPKTQNASCPLTNAPSPADDKALSELGIKTVDKQ